MGNVPEALKWACYEGINVYIFLGNDSIMRAGRMKNFLIFFLEIAQKREG